MRQMSMKLPVMFDQNPPHTFDKILKKLITTKNPLKACLDSKCQGHSRSQGHANANSSKTICRPPPYGRST